MSKTILLVEDEALIALSEAQILKKHGYEVITVHSGEHAVETVETAPEISLVLMDIDLGEGMDGTDAAERILEHHDLPIVFLSSHTEPEVVEKTEAVTSYGYIAKHSGETVLLASIKMAFRLHRAHTELNNREEELQTTLEEYKRSTRKLLKKNAELKQTENFINNVFYSVQDGISVLNPDLTIRVVNDVIKTWYPENRDLSGLKCYAVYHNADEPCAACPAVRALSTGKTESAEVPGRSDSPVEWVELFAYPMRDTQTGDITGVVEFVRDITQRKHLEHESRRNERHYRSLYNSIRDAVIVVNKDREIIDCNSTFTELFGYSLSEIQGYTTAVLFADDSEYERLGRLMKQQSDAPCILYEARYRKKSGEVFLGEKKIQYLKHDDGRPEGFIGLIRDVTERKRSEERTQALVREKEYLLKEVQHRIKNTMSTMAGMLALKADELQDNTEAETALLDAQSRFQSMEVLYDLLYRGKEHESASVGEYLEQLVHKIIHLFPFAQSVQLTTDIEDFPLDAKRLSELGIVVNELVTNAMKYAFSHRREGRLSVSARRGDGHVTVVVEDDGPGVAEDLETDTEQSFGMTLVRAYADQLGGEIQFDGEHGTRAMVRFPE